MTMRKFLLPLAALAALMPLSCRQPVEIPVVPDSAGGDDPAVVDPDPVFGGDVVFSATIAALPDGTQPVWKEGEAIVLSDGTSVQTLVNAGPEGVLLPSRPGSGSRPDTSSRSARRWTDCPPRSTASC